MVYQFKRGSHIKADAQTAGEMCEKLEKTVGLTPENLLDANREENAPLHDAFEWRDDVAAEKYRVHQAGHIIRCLCVVSESEQRQEPVRAFFKFQEADSYESTAVIIQRADGHAQLLALARKELEAFVKKYKLLEELAPVMQAIRIVNGGGIE